MKTVAKIFLILFTLSTVLTSCREVKEDNKVEEAVEDVGDGVEDAAEEVEDAVE
ncbi:hypothetical protein [Tamlana crocina]|uniref:Entericidin EcnAB n=1 Tax=Tamlana crocina TaxID=393006 RepID=A0ABX1DGZ4_9FLAO|nr:hypothetical protein [Tamlana crocina]NJX16349.1 hypothetical protein [Tamlana crocina]